MSVVESPLPIPSYGLPPFAPDPGYPPRKDHDIEPWLDEQMWGHRLYAADSWLIFLEFLTVADGCERNPDGRLLEPGGPYPLTFRPRQRMYLRNILFNSDDIGRIAEEFRDSRRAWDRWLQLMSDRAQATGHDYSYLRARFHSFDEFARIVRLLRSAVVERETSKRWTSRFLFPFGPHALYEDLNLSPSGTTTREYINFGRTGELLYLMLCRCSSREELVDYLRRMVDGSSRWNRVVAALQPNTPEDEVTRGKSYLPYASHPVFDTLGEDWLALSRMPIPVFDAYPYLVKLANFHLVRYHLAVGAAWAEKGDPVTMVCEIVAPRRTLVREISLMNYGQNDGLSTEAIERFVSRLRQSTEWQSALGDYGAFERCRDLLRAWVNWPDDKYSGPNDPEALLKTLRTDALARHRRHLAQFHRMIGRDIGLVSKRGTTRLRYAPTDEFMQSLLFANVPVRMEFGEFLERLYRRYGLVIGDHEAEVAIPSEDLDRKAFQRNAQRLELRLASLGLLRRLSDACAYVINPYAGSTI